MAEMCHWIVTGITLTSVNASSGLDDGAYILELNSEFGVEGHVTELMEYLPPSPPPMTKDHRYVFALLAPDGDEAGGELTKPKDRPHWGYGKVGKGVVEWARENGLVAVGKSAIDVLEAVIEAAWKNSELNLKQERISSMHRTSNNAKIRTCTQAYEMRTRCLILPSLLGGQFSPCMILHYQLLLLIKEPRSGFTYP